MKTYFKYIFLLLVLIVSSCKEEEQEKPKVTYKESPSEVALKRDTTQIKIADLPIQMDGTNYLIHPIGDVRVYNGGSSKFSYGSSSTNRVSYAISNYNRYEITGYLNNIYIQHIDSTSSKPLTTDTVVIQSATYLYELAEKTKKQILVYTLSDLDTNKDGKLDVNDINSLYISEISGSGFMKLSPDYQELIDWNLIESKNRLYFRTKEDSNKNGDFDKDDAVSYYYVDLMDKEWKLNEYKPFD
jgi:hypothetical protein